MHKSQAAKKEAAMDKSPTKTPKASSRLQGISEEGEARKQEEEGRMKELQSQRAGSSRRWCLLRS